MVWIIVAVVAVLFFVLTYNSLISKVNQIKNAEGSIDVYLKQRYDVIPNLVEVAKQFMDHEDKMFTKIIELRTRGQAAKNMHETIQCNKEIDQALKGFMVTVENYPTLQSNENFIRVQESLLEIENNIAASRRFYNSAVVAYNESIQMIPGNFLAPFLGMRERETFSIPESERATPNMKELFKK